MAENALSTEFFEEKYRTVVDPWNFAESPYEQGRYNEIIQSLDRRRFHRAFEPGCSIGILTERLAATCDEVIAIDISPTAVARARTRCAQWPGVTVEVGALPQSIPKGPFDLLVFSEVGYYFSADTLASLAAELTLRLPADGIFIAVHWLGSSMDHVLSGDEVHEILGGTAGLVRVSSRRCEGFRVEMWRRS